MKKNILPLVIILSLSACGGSSSSSEPTLDGGLSGGSASTSESSSNSSNNECAVSFNAIYLANGASCDLTANIVTTYELDILSIASSSSASCDSAGALTVGPFSSGSSTTLNGLSFICGS